MNRHESQRGYFAYQLHQQMQQDSDIWVITPDLGFGMLDYIQRDFPQRYINTGAAEQSALGIAVGLAMAGKKPFVYSITPFLLRRPYETIKLYVDHEGIPVRLVGGGRDQDYSHDGFSHDASDALSLLKTLPNIAQWWPSDKEQVPGMVAQMVEQNVPAFISLKR